MGKFKLTCCRCGSDNVLEKSRIDAGPGDGTGSEYREGIQRKCLECDNEEFSVFRTWTEYR